MSWLRGTTKSDYALTVLMCNEFVIFSGQDGQLRFSDEREQALWPLEFNSVYKSASSSTHHLIPGFLPAFLDAFPCRSEGMQHFVPSLVCSGHQQAGHERRPFTR